MLVTKREPTHGYNDAYSVGTPNWACWVKSGQKNRKTTVSPMVRRVFLVNKRTIFFFWWLVLWMLHFGRARHPGLGKRHLTSGQLSVEFVNVGGWLTNGDLALDSCSQFLAVAEPRFFPSGARSINHQLQKAGHQSVWSPTCQDQVAGGLAGVGCCQPGRCSSCLAHICYL